MRRNVYILILVLFTATVQAQDLQLTQFYASPLYLNPAFTGANADSRVSTNFRNQWAGLPGTYKSFLVSYDQYLYNYKSGVGAMIISDKAGTQGFSNNMMALSYAYDYRFQRFWSLSMGMRVGYGWRSLDFSRLLFGDQIARNSATTLQTPIPEKVNYLDISTGVLLFSTMEWIGVSFNHINRPEETFLNNEAVLPIKGSVHGGINFPIGNSGGDGRLNEKPVIVTAFQYRFQKDFDQLDLGLYYKKQNYFAGLWYRGLPGFKAYKPGYANHDCVALLIGGMYKNFTLGYSYDITISQLGMTSGGSHEISLGYDIVNPKKPKKHRSKIIPCPKF